MKDFDYILVGTGQATATLLGGLPQDASIAVIEGDKIGGTCVNTGCTPTKTLVASAKVAHMARRAAEYGINVGEVSIDFAKVIARMNEVRGASNQGLTSWLESDSRVSLFHGWAKFAAPKEIQIGNEIIRGETIFLNVGGRPRKPTTPGLESVPWLDNGRLLDLSDLPEHLIVVGGSYIALEFSQMFRRFGAEVTVIERSDDILRREDSDVARAVREIMAAEGIHFELGARVSQVAPSSSGGVELSLEVGGGGKTLTGSHLLMATGRVPNSDRLAVDKARLELDDRGYI
ncbi:MAG: FAD-dependent oxidoreductase, partial [Deinococcota bacterium]